ncbi:MAG: 30S ribosomal protein S20 [bacterium]|nr:30S ribosomal protein S20 [bacterium]
MITKSAKKAYRQTVRRREVNIQRSKALKTVLKNYKKLVLAKDLKGAQEQLRLVFKALDKSAKVNLIKKNTASRLKSRLSKLLSRK